MGRTWDLAYAYFFHSKGAFSPSNSPPRVYFITWEMHGFPHQFPIAWNNLSKLLLCGEPGKLVLIPFPKNGYFFLIQFPSHSIVHQIENAWVFPLFSHSIVKYSKAHQIEWTWEIGVYIFQIVWIIFSSSFPSYSTLHYIRNGCLLLSLSHSMKIAEKPNLCVKLGI